VGPLIISMVKDATGSYSQTLYVFAGFFIVAFIVSILMILNIKSIKNKKAKHHR
jgi:OFA family oxalate/formate antiporter-like MFS transporter